MGHHVFRGITAAASLKLRMVRFVVNAVPVVFRGITAAASLKRLLRCRSSLFGLRVFRGITAAASLKRAAAGMSLSPTYLSSAASLPRPH